MTDTHTCLLEHSREMERSFTIYSHSQHSRDVHARNRPDDFTIQLPKIIELPGQWECGLVQFHCDSNRTTGYFICSDLLEESFVGDSKLPLFRRVRVKTSHFAQILYIPVKLKRFQSIRVYLRSWHLQPARAVRGSTYCTLHFRRRRRLDGTS